VTTDAALSLCGCLTSAQRVPCAAWLTFVLAAWRYLAAHPVFWTHLVPNDLADTDPANPGRCRARSCAAAGVRRRGGSSWPPRRPASWPAAASYLISSLAQVASWIRPVRPRHAWQDGGGERGGRDDVDLEGPAQLRGRDGGGDAEQCDGGRVVDQDVDPAGYGRVPALLLVAEVSAKDADPFGRCAPPDQHGVSRPAARLSGQAGSGRPWPRPARARQHGPRPRARRYVCARVPDQVLAADRRARPGDVRPVRPFPLRGADMTQSDHALVALEIDAFDGI
jgi:hypothetical protein